MKEFTQEAEFLLMSVFTAVILTNDKKKNFGEICDLLFLLGGITGGPPLISRLQQRNKGQGQVTG